MFIFEKKLVCWKHRQQLVLCAHIAVRRNIRMILPTTNVSDFRNEIIQDDALFLATMTHFISAPYTPPPPT
jgi:hypothetical protein